MDKATRKARRQALRGAVQGGALLLFGNEEAPKNYLGNPYPFRQDSSFLYFVGVDQPGLAALLLPDGEEWLFGAPEHPDDLIWHGPHPDLADHAEAAGIAKHAAMAELGPRLGALLGKGVEIHYLPPYRADRAVRLSELLSRPIGEIASGASRAMVRAVVELRSRKTEAEVREIEEALGISKAMYEAAYPMIRPGRYEREISGAMQGAALAMDRAQSFNPIVSVRGEVLHNVSYSNRLEAGQILLVDSGTESRHHYASDITRAYPVSGTFTPEQRDIYEVVLGGQRVAIENAGPTMTNRDLHLMTALRMAEGLKTLGLMKGDPGEAVEAGAHALFFVHGLGHMLGLDVHDMEDLGDAVGYPEGEARSSQFGLAFLRLSRRLEPGFVITVEPGIYFVPALIERWRSEGRHKDFICYDRLGAFLSFGGVRIEDDLLITSGGARVLGPPIPKTVAEVEGALAR
ncbi:MAG: Xaa-Pro aminopeptidase [Polyangia bacterium]|nr:Xaa-Pro aminopeptidase [Polyangia bacterium]